MYLIVIGSVVGGCVVFGIIVLLIIRRVKAHSGYQNVN